MSIAENIKKLREKHNMTQAVFGEMSGVSDKAVSTWENGTAEPRLGAIQKIAQYFNISKGSIIEDEAPSPFGLPIIGVVCAGDGLYAYDEYQGRFDIKSHIDADYVLKVDGDSMIGANIFDGDYVFIKKNDFFNDGDVYAVEMLLTGDASLKKIYRNGDNVILTPCNPDYAPVATSLDQIRIIGRCVGVYHSR